MAQSIHFDPVISCHPHIWVQEGLLYQRLFWFLAAQERLTTRAVWPKVCFAIQAQLPDRMILNTIEDWASRLPPGSFVSRKVLLMGDRQ